MAIELNPTNLRLVAEKLKKANRAVRAASFTTEGAFEPDNGTDIAAIRAAITAESTVAAAAKAVVDLM